MTNIKNVEDEMKTKQSRMLRGNLNEREMGEAPQCVREEERGDRWLLCLFCVGVGVAVVGFVVVVVIVVVACVFVCLISLCYLVLLWLFSDINIFIVVVIVIVIVCLYVICSLLFCCCCRCAVSWFFKTTNFIVSLDRESRDTMV